jgi:hypothetical protein
MVSSTKGIPKEVIEELKLKIDKTPSFDSKIIVERHQASVKIPKELRIEMNLPLGSSECKIELKDEKTFLVEVL